ncbi:hypothetical protein [Pseudomonas syringae group genomosp. 3]|uniref:hypothetical protein n=1 Tax=Pseudomonas syringae group genomosp. 3 TaxID=251701 RepID=UPI0006B90167|nr:hypothetical protein [Pseudomonas syringae group genomosp. 3]
MSKFEEIQEQFIALRDAEFAYWERLNEARLMIRKGFASYLDVDPDEKVGASGEPRLWFGVKKTFSAKPEQDMVQESNELVFTLNLVLDDTKTTFPPSTLSFRFRLKLVADRYLILEDGVDTIYMMIEDDFTPFYEHLHQSCKQKLATFTRLI